MAKKPSARRTLQPAADSPPLVEGRDPLLVSPFGGVGMVEFVRENLEAWRRTKAARLYASATAESVEITEALSKLGSKRAGLLRRRFTAWTKPNVTDRPIGGWTTSLAVADSSTQGLRARNAIMADLLRQEMAEPDVDLQAARYEYARRLWLRDAADLCTATTMNFIKKEIDRIRRQGKVRAADAEMNLRITRYAITKTMFDFDEPHPLVQMVVPVQAAPMSVVRVVQEQATPDETVMRYSTSIGIEVTYSGRHADVGSRLSNQIAGYFADFLQGLDPVMLSNDLSILTAAKPLPKGREADPIAVKIHGKTIRLNAAEPKAPKRKLAAR